MNPDDHVCLCFHVSMRKIVNYCKREKPRHASMISDCLSAGTGCGWCVPFLKKLHEQAIAGEAEPDLPVSPEDYVKKRATFRQTKKREEVLLAGENTAEKGVEGGGEKEP